MSVSTTERRVALVAVLASSTCRFGGPSAEPPWTVVDGGASAAETGGQRGASGDGLPADSGGGGGSTGGQGEGQPEAGVDAAEDASDDVAAPEGGVDLDASLVDVGETGHGDSGGDAVDGATPCLPPFSSAVCDPVCNTGCPPLFRCDIADAPRTGVCVGSLLSAATEGMACLRTALTDDCSASLSCIEGTCRRLCYRDADCTTSGTCCNVAIDSDAGPSGYRLCAPCTP